LEKLIAIIFAKIFLLFALKKEKDEILGKSLKPN